MVVQDCLAGMFRNRSMVSLCKICANIKLGLETNLSTFKYFCLNWFSLQISRFLISQTNKRCRTFLVISACAIITCSGCTVVNRSDRRILYIDDGIPILCICKKNSNEYVANKKSSVAFYYLLFF